MLKNKQIILGRILPLSSNKIHQTQEVYSINGIMCTIAASHYKNPPKVMVNDNRK